MKTKEAGAPIAKSMMSFFARKSPVYTLIEGIGSVGCVSCARANAGGGRPLCVGASYVGVTLVHVLPL
jgi:hypothetical protein